MKHALTTVFSYCIGIISMKTVLGVGNRNSVFQKADFHHGKNGRKVVTDN